MQANKTARWEMPDAALLARLVNVVTTTMFGVTFEVAGPPVVPGHYTRMAAITIGGAHPLRVALASDAESCAALCGRLFGCAPDQLDSWMPDDALCELVNMAAGQIKTAVAPDMQLTVPRIMTPPLISPAIEADGGRDVILRADKLHLLLSITRQA